MELLMIYCIFAVTTAVAALLELFWPVVSELRVREPRLKVCENWIITLISLTLFAVVVAPLVFLATVIPSYSVRFRASLMTSLESSG